MRSDTHDFELVAPPSLDAVLGLLAAEPGAWTPIAGGTELMVALGAGKLRARRLVSLAACRELRFLDADDDAVTVGSGTTFTDLRHSDLIASEFPLLAQAASWTGSIANQNRGTLGGNIANASPAADSSPALLVYDATIRLVSQHGLRELPYRDFHLGYKRTGLREGELIHSLRLPRTCSTLGPPVAFIRKVGTRNAMAISKVVLAALAWVEDGTVARVRLAGASLAETPLRLSGTEQLLAGRAISPDLLRDARAALLAEIRPIDDIRSTAAYRSAVAANLLEDFLRSLPTPQHLARNP